MIKEAIILAGGLGTRLKGVIDDIPKPMAPINDTPFIQYLFDYLINHSVTHAVLAVGYKHEVIKQHFGSKYKTLNLLYAIEHEPLGTGGGIANALDLIKNDNCFLLNGDTFFDVNLKELNNQHQANNANLTLSLKEMINFDRYGTVEFNKYNKITLFNEKKEVKKGYINGGVYIITKQLFTTYQAGEKFSFEQDIMEKSINKLNVHAHICKGYFIDIGIPEDYSKANSELPELFES